MGVVVSQNKELGNAYEVYDAVVIQKRKESVTALTKTPSADESQARRGDSAPSIAIILSQLADYNNEFAEIQNSPHSQALSVTSQIEFTDGERQNSLRSMKEDYGTSGDQKIIDFFVVLNMMYSDYCHVAKKLGVDRMDFYAEMAKAFMADPDANEGKLVKYREYIAKEEE